MKETSNIFGWLGAAEKHSILRDAERHIEDTCQAVAFLADAVKALVAGDHSAKGIAIENVRQSERAADKLLNRMVEQMTEGLVLPLDREDLMRLAKALDKIADSTNSAAKHLWFIEERLPDAVLTQMSAATELIVLAVQKLREAIRAMSRHEIKEAMDSCEEVERVEHEADDQKRHFLGAVLKAKLEPPMLLVCYNLAESLESVTDKVEAVSDLLKLLAVKCK